MMRVSIEHLQRIGCWPCPMTPLGTFEIMKETHPQLVAELYSKLRTWNKEQRHEVWVQCGLWRFRQASHLAHNFPVLRPCATDLTNYLSVPGTNSESVNYLKVFGEQTSQAGFTTIENKNQNLKIIYFKSGKIRIEAQNEEYFKPLVERQLLKSMLCIKCGTCQGNCSQHAIDLSDGYFSVNSNCNHCLECLGFECPGLQYNLEL